jgi:hypothetical protein
VFLDLAEKALYPDWDEAAARLVAGFEIEVANNRRLFRARGLQAGLLGRQHC